MTTVVNRSVPPWTVLAAAVLVVAAEIRPADLAAILAVYPQQLVWWGLYLLLALGLWRRSRTAQVVAIVIAVVNVLTGTVQLIFGSRRWFRRRETGPVTG